MAALRRLVECVSPNVRERWGDVVSIEQGRGVGGTRVDEHDLPNAKGLGGQGDQESDMTRKSSHEGSSDRVGSAALLCLIVLGDDDGDGRTDYGGQPVSDSRTVSTPSPA